MVLVGIQISSIVFLSVILFTSSFAFGAGITLNIDEKPDSNKIIVSGTNDVSDYTYLQLVDPEGKQIWNNTYRGNVFESMPINTTGDKWNKPGIYKITASPCADGSCKQWNQDLSQYIISESYYHEDNPADQVAGGDAAPVLDQGLIIGILTLAIIGAIAAFVIWYWTHRGRKPEPPTNLTATAAAGPIIPLEWEDPTETSGDPING